MDYWLKEAQSKDYPVSYSEIVRQQYFLSCSKEDILRDAHIFHIDAPLHVLFPNGGSRHMAKEFKCHVLNKNTPEGSFIKLTDNLYIICPELTFLMAANYMPLHELVELGTNLCAIYRQDYFTKYGQSRREQVTTAADIRNYLGLVRNFPGLVNARRAAAYVLDCSNSPEESKIFSLFRLPICLGGAGINGLTLNYNYQLGQQAAQFIKRDTCCIDAASVAKKKGFEYDSNLTHLTPDQHDYDKKRLTAMQMSGFSIFTITAKNIDTTEEIEELMLSARSFLGLRTYMDRFNKYRYIRERVIHDLFLAKKNKKPFDDVQDPKL